MSLSTQAKAFGHYIDQPHVIEKAARQAKWVGALGLAGIFGWDAFRAQPQERQKVMVRDGLVLGATALGTIAAAVAVPKMMGKLVAEEAEDLAARKIKEAVDGIRHKYPEAIQRLMDQGTRTKAEFVELIQGMREAMKKRIADPAEAAREAKADIDKILPVELDGDFWGSMKKCAEFGLIGLSSCLSGLGGGWLANKVNGTSSREANANMIKEGIFQFIANILLCAVGAAIAISFVNLKAVKPLLNKLGGFTKLARTGIIGTGLSLGIVFGGFIANKVGRHVNPMIDRIQGLPPQKHTEGGKRKIEFMDAILHLDDVPTALALAGVKIMEPFIPLFFAFSGYRTGIGYRNDGSQGFNAPGRPEPMPPAANPFRIDTAAPSQPLSFASNPVFRSFQQRGMSAANQPIPQSFLPS